MESILVTGGAGYIGSHTTLKLLQDGAKVVVLDNLINSSLNSILRISEIAKVKPIFIQGDIRNRQLLENILTSHSISSVIHFAGLKAVGESVRLPIEYYDNNLNGSLILIQAMQETGVRKLVFSSSATVYGAAAISPIKEDSPIGNITNPYGRTKYMIENVLKDLCAIDKRWSVAILRYFNPIGAHRSGLIGEDPKGTPNNLLPYICQVAIGKLPYLTIFGNDYPTPDGTGIRDYIHVEDLAAGHLSALKTLKIKYGANIWNLGTGIGYSVLEVVKTFEEVSGLKIKYKIANRRAGDIAECFSDNSKIISQTNWRNVYNLHDMAVDAWRWQKNNCNGYK